MPADAPNYGRFGRFGRFHDDGLLTLSVTPRGFVLPPTGPSFQVRWGDPQAALSAIVPRIDPTEKVLAIQGGGDGAPVSIRYTLLYPGVAASFGKRMVLHFADRAGRPLRCGIDPSRFRTAGILVIPGDRFPTVPLLIVPPHRPDLKVWYDGANLTLESATDLGEIRFVTPTGIAKCGRLADAWRDALPWVDLPVPARTGYKAVLNPDGASVTLTETFDVPVAPVPPVLAFAMEKGYPADVSGALVRTRAVTKWGRYAYVASRILRTTLPVPPASARGYVRPAAPDTRRLGLVDALVGHLGGQTATNAVDLGYAGMANAQLAHPLLGAATRDALAAAWAAHLPRAFDIKPPAWNPETEPITGHAYPWTHGVEGPAKRRYGIERGNALPLVGLAVYARYTGDWKRVSEFWPAVRRIRRYFDLADDWAWMTACQADHGYSTGKGDPLCAVYAAAASCRVMARALGDRAGEESAAVWAARVAVPTVARLWYTDFARATGQIGRDALVLGYHEAEGFTRCVPGKDDPWNATSLISATGCLPEVMELVGTYARPALRAYEDSYAAAYPRWFDPTVKYPFPVAYRGNSLYVVLPHLYARSVALEEGAGAGLVRLDRAMGNRDNGWIGPNVVAELVARQSPLLLTDWGTAGYLDGVAEEGDAAVALRFRAGAAGEWTLSGRLRKGLYAVSARIDAAEVPVAQDGRAFTVVGRVVAGEFSVRILLTTTPPAQAPILSPGPVPRPPVPVPAGLAGGRVP